MHPASRERREAARQPAQELRDALLVLAQERASEYLPIYCSLSSHYHLGYGQEPTTVCEWKFSGLDQANLGCSEAHGSPQWHLTYTLNHAARRKAHSHDVNSFCDKVE